MNTFLIILIITVEIAVSDYFIYRLLMRRDINVAPPEEKPVKQKDEPEETLQDNSLTKAERIYLEGLQAVFNYDVDVMKKHLRGEDAND